MYVQFPSDLPITSTDLTSIRGVGLFGPSKSMTFSAISSQTVTLTNGCETYISPDFDATLDFTQISNPISTKPTESLIISITDKDGNSIASISSGVQYVATSGALTSATMSGSPTIISSTSSVSVSLLPAHKITTVGALKITFPTAISFPSTLCTLSNQVAISTSATCSISGQIMRISNPFTTDYIPSSSGTISFTASSITMPGTSAPTTSYIFQTVLVSSNIDYVIDKETYTNMITATAGTLTSVSVSPSSSIANALTTYTITFKNTHAIVQNGKVVVTFPSTVTISNPTQSANQCTRISGIEAGFSWSITSSTVTVNGGYTSSALAAGNTVSFSVGSITSPVSMQTSGSFSVETKTSADYNIDTIYSGVTITMASVNDITSVSLSPESLVNGATTNIEFTLVASSPLTNGDKILITYPTEVSAPTGTFTWSGNIALASSLTCSKSSTSPSIITMTVSFGSITSISAGELLKFTISKNINPPTTEPSSTFDFQIVNTNNYDINSYSGIIRLTTTDAAQFTSSSVTASNNVASLAVTLTFNFTLAHSIPAGGIIYIYYPSQITYDSSTFTCSCVNSVSSSSTCVCTHQIVSGEGQLLITNAFPSGLTLGNSVKITLTGFNNSAEAVTTNSFKIQTYTAQTNGYKIDKIESGLTLKANWNYPCLTCGSTSTTCNSCITTLDPYRLQDNTCILTCDDDRFYNSTTNEWEHWATPWSSWSTTDKNVWITWGETGYEFLSGTTWVGSCPTKTFGNQTTNKWDNWDASVAHCLNCQGNAFTCTSCNKSSAFAYLQNSICVSSCPLGTYIQNESTFAWDSCNSNCKECSGITTNCTIWNSGMFLDLRTYTCVSTCDINYTIKSGSVCLPWDSNCATWAGSTTTCTSCSSNLVKTTSYTCASGWTNTNEIVVNKSCTQWNSTCSKCVDSTTNCTEWAINYALFENECISDCPLQYEDQDRVWVFVGLVCPDNYILNDKGDSCIPIIKECPGSKVLNDEKSKCIPPPGKIVPFPFLFIVLWFIFLVVAGKIKDKARSKIISNLIPLLGLIELPALALLLITAAFVEAWITFGLAFLWMAIYILLNIIMYCLFKKHTLVDEDFKYFAKRYPKTSDALPFLWWIWSFRVLKFFYSGFFGLDTWMLVLSKPNESFLRYFNRVNIWCFIFVHIPAYAACAIGILTLMWGYQALVEWIEIPLILITILVLTIIERCWVKSHLNRNTYLPIKAKGKYDDDIAVMSAVPLHRSMTKDRFEESKTDNFSETIEADSRYNKDLDYDVELRKKALMSIVNHIKNPRRNSIFSDSDRSIQDCTFFEEEKQKYQSVQRREIKRPIRRAFSFTELKPIDEEEEFLLSEEDMSDDGYQRGEKSSPKLQRRMSFPMRVEELKDVENLVFSEAIDEYRNTLLKQHEDNVYADSRPPKPVIIQEPPVMADMTTQTMLRDLIFEENSDEEHIGVEYEDVELESDFAGGIIGGIIDNLSETSEFRDPRQLGSDRLREIPDFELEDILGLFDVDENGNFIFKSHKDEEVDNTNHRVNRKGYLIDK